MAASMAEERAVVRSEMSIGMSMILEEVDTAGRSRRTRTSIGERVQGSFREA